MYLVCKFRFWIWGLEDCRLLFGRFFVVVVSLFRILFVCCFYILGLFEIFISLGVFCLVIWSLWVFWFYIGIGLVFLCMFF